MSVISACLYESMNSQCLWIFKELKLRLIQVLPTPSSKKKTPPLSLRSQNHSVILRYHHPLLEGASGVRLHCVRSNVDSQLCFCASKPYVKEISGDKLFCVCAAFKNDCFLILFQESWSTWWLLDNGNHVSVFHPWGNMGVEVQREWSGSRGGGGVWFVPTLQQSCQTVSALTRRSCATVGPQG